uniref:Uncharacterized protein n=1 Tax=Glossina brevipalpis TaxID=37001 RepID=A0A1A9X1R0_9MUSC
MCILRCGVCGIRLPTILCTVWKTCNNFVIKCINKLVVEYAAVVSFYTKLPVGGIAYDKISLLLDTIVYAWYAFPAGYMTGCLVHFSGMFRDERDIMSANYMHERNLRKFTATKDNQYNNVFFSHHKHEHI